MHTIGRWMRAIQIDTPGYFEYVEKSLMAQTPRGEGGAGPRACRTLRRAIRRRSRATAALVTLVAAQVAGNFVMTPKMRRLAAEQGVPEKEWAQNYVRLLAEGRITPIS